jgi:hypothetical protein
MDLNQHPPFSDRETPGDGVALGQPGRDTCFSTAMICASVCLFRLIPATLSSKSYSHLDELAGSGHIHCRESAHSVR